MSVLTTKDKGSARKVGTHRRLALTYLIAYRDASATRRRDALDELTRQAEDLGLYNA